MYIIRQSLTFLLYLAPFLFLSCSFSAQQDEHTASRNQIYLVRKTIVCEILLYFWHNLEGTDKNRGIQMQKLKIKQLNMMQKSKFLSLQTTFTCCDKSLKLTFHNWQIKFYSFLVPDLNDWTPIHHICSFGHNDI